jgi:hypothetical protein
VAILILLTAAYPLARAWRASRDTTLIHTITWAVAAWAAWLVALAADMIWPGFAGIARYLALSLTGCAGVAVLGARRPGVMAWDFVVLGLLAVLLLPLVEGLGELRLDPLRLAFLAATLAVGALNYLPTRLAAAMVCLMIGCGYEVLLLALPESQVPNWQAGAPFTRFLLAISPWVAFQQIAATRNPASEFDQIWLSFRDCYGLVWSQRTREQFNHAAAHAGWPVFLRWRGLRIQPGASIPDMKMKVEMMAALCALLKRFGRGESEKVENQ